MGLYSKICYLEVTQHTGCYQPTQNRLRVQSEPHTRQKSDRLTDADAQPTVALPPQEELAAVLLEGGLVEGSRGNGFVLPWQEEVPGAAVL